MVPEQRNALSAAVHFVTAEPEPAAAARMPVVPGSGMEKWDTNGDGFLDAAEMQAMAAAAGGALGAPPAAASPHPKGGGGGGTAVSALFLFLLRAFSYLGVCQGSRQTGWIPCLFLASCCCLFRMLFLPEQTHTTQPFPFSSTRNAHYMSMYTCWLAGWLAAHWLKRNLCPLDTKWLRQHRKCQGPEGSLRPHEFCTPALSSPSL